MASNYSCYNNYDCKSGLFLPFMNKYTLLPFVNEYTWNVHAREVLYLLGLLWCFLGLTIITDVFMCAVSRITSITRTIKVANPAKPEGYEKVYIKVWNNTVANLTLMALGYSIPEILLSCIEVIGKDFKYGNLGPSTIVGSAAFNLLVITAVCIVCIESGGTRRIKAIKVFAVTATCSIFAYIWIIIILVLVSPGLVELWEAATTLFFFPIMIIAAYIADGGCCCCCCCCCCAKKKENKPEIELGFDAKPDIWNGRHFHMNPKEMEELIKELGKNLNLDKKDVARLVVRKVAEPQQHSLVWYRINATRNIKLNLEEKDVARLATKKVAERQHHHNRLWYRINATRHITGGPKLTPTLPKKLTKLYQRMKANELHLVADDQPPLVDDSEGGELAVLEFTATQVSILEAQQTVRLGIRRYGKIDHQVLVKFQTVDGTAEQKKDYIAVKKTIVFEPEATDKYVDVTIIDDHEYEPDEIFFCKIAVEPKQNAIVGKKYICEVLIINDDDEPGTIEFDKPSLLFKESVGKASIPVKRVNGANGEITVGWKTDATSATDGSDFKPGEGTIIFEHGETTKIIDITIIDNQEAELKGVSFAVSLLDPSGGAKLGRYKKTIITIINDDEFNGIVSRLVDLTNMNMDALRVDNNTWKDQFRNAFFVNGGDVDSATRMDYVMHFVTFGWKVIFAFCPPPTILGGWVSFVVALGMIGVVTAIVGDLALIFGCLVGLSDYVIGLTIVALGTSLPNLFASKQAATHEATADNSIGNVTGSNSVIVFLGLGLPWLIASIYQTFVKGAVFYVEAGNLVFSVLMYIICAIICVGLLVLRRFQPFFGRAELGGPKGSKIACGVFLIALLIFCVLISSLQAYGIIKVNF